METVILKILSFFMTAAMFITNFLGSIFPWKDLISPVLPLENAAFVFDAELFEADSNEEHTVVSNYFAWCLIAEEDSEELKKYDKNFFKKANAVLIPVTLPSSAYSVTVDSVESSDNTVFVEYTLVNDGTVGADAEIELIIVVETAKSVDAAKITFKEADIPIPDPEPDPDPVPDPEPEPEPVLGTMDGYNYGIFNAVNFNENFFYTTKTKFISSFDKWNEYFIGSDEYLSKYDEEFFEKNSLAIAFTEVPEGKKDVLVVNISTISNDNAALSIDLRVKNGDGKQSEGHWAAVVEVTKEITRAYCTEIGLKGETYLHEMSLFNEDKFVMQDGAYQIVSDKETWDELTSLYYNADYYLSGSFFADSSVAVITIMLPDSNYNYRVDSRVENGDTLELGCTPYISEYYSEEYTTVEYIVLLAEVSKDIKKVEITENTFKNRFDIILTSNFDIPSYDAVILISDYTEWRDKLKTDIPALKKYDESFFETNSVVLIPEVFHPALQYVQMIKLHENGESIDILYKLVDRYKGMAGTAIVEYQTLVIEVSKNVKMVSAKKAKIENGYKTFNYYGPFSFEGNRIIISDYETWISCVEKQNEELERYNEDYFKNNSVVLMNIVTPNIDGELTVHYLEERGNVLEFGYTVVNLSMFPALGNETILIEVSKNITEINAVEFE